MADRSELYAQTGVDPENVGSMGSIARFLMGHDPGITTPSGRILINEQFLSDLPAREREQSLRDTLVHEQTHVRQQRPRGTLGSWLNILDPRNAEPYGQRSDELEAYQAENEARARQGLPPNPVPTFHDTRSWLDLLRGEPTPFRTRGDIPLRRDALLRALNQ